MSETQHHDLQQDQDHFIQSGARPDVHLDDVPDASEATNRDRAKAHALWPSLLCVAGAFRCRLVLVVVCVFCMWCLWCWCSWGCVCFLLLVVFRGLFVCFLLVVLKVLDGVMGAALVFMGFDGCDRGFVGASHETPNTIHCRTHHTIRKRHYVFQKHITQPLKPLEATLRVPKATVEPLRATQKSHEKATQGHSEPLKRPCWFFKFEVRGLQGPALPRSWVTSVRSFHVRGGLCSRIVLGRAGALVNCSIVARTEISKTPMIAHKNLLHTHRGSQKSRRHPSRHGHCPVDTGVVWLVELLRF